MTTITTEILNRTHFIHIVQQTLASGSDEEIRLWMLGALILLLRGMAGLWRVGAPYIRDPASLEALGLQQLD